MYVRRAERGVSLMEGLAVLVLMVIVTVGFYQAMVWRNQATYRSQYAALQAQEMLLIGKAAQQYAEANGSGWSANAVLRLTTPTHWSTYLAPNLPTGFAIRGGLTGGRGPLWDTYRVSIHKDDQDPPNYRVVVADQGGTPSAVMLRRAGIENTAGGLSGYRGDVASRIVREYSGTGGVMAANTWVATGPNGMFSMNLTTPRAFFTGTAATVPVTVALVGWPEFNPYPPITIPDIDIELPPWAQYGECVTISAQMNITGSVYQQCSSPNRIYANPLCPSMGSQVCPGPYPEEVARMEPCRPAGTMRSTDIGTYTYGVTTVEVLTNDVNGNAAYGAGYACTDAQCNGLVNKWTLQTVSLNNVEVMRYVCEVEFHFVNAWGSLQTSQHTWTLGGGYPQRRDLVCCQPRDPEP